MISAKEAYDISFVNDVCKEYLESIEKDIVKAAKAGKYDVSIELAERGLAVSEEDHDGYNRVFKKFRILCNYLQD